MIDLYSNGEVADLMEAVTFSGTPAEVARRVLEVRDVLRSVVLVGGVRAIDYESASEPKGEGAPRVAIPRGIFAVELLRDVDGLLRTVYQKLGEGVEARRAWRMWCLYRRPVAPWQLQNIAALESITEHRARYALERVDAILYTELETREWRLA